MHYPADSSARRAANRPQMPVSFVINAFPTPYTHGYMIFWLAVALQERTCHDELQKMLDRAGVNNIAKRRALTHAVNSTEENLKKFAEKLVEYGGLLYLHDGLRAEHCAALGIEVQA